MDHNDRARHLGHAYAWGARLDDLGSVSAQLASLPSTDATDCAGACSWTRPAARYTTEPEDSLTRC